MQTDKPLDKLFEPQNILNATWLEKCVNHLNDAIVITETDLYDEPGPRILWANDVFYKLTGYEPSEIIGQSPRILQGPLTDKSVLTTLRKALDKWEVCRVEVVNYKKNGSTFWNEFEVTPVSNELGYYTHWIAVQRDITQRKHAEQELEEYRNNLEALVNERTHDLNKANEKLKKEIVRRKNVEVELIYREANLEHTLVEMEDIAHYDSLTKLPNRILLADRLSQGIAQCHRRKRSLGVAFIDLDGFKAVNDNYGHSVGDELLIAVAHRMKEALREGDTLARIGGDEFVAGMVDLEQLEDSTPLLERLLKAASDPFTLGHDVIQVSASIGIAFYPQDSENSEQLIRQADQAMYIAKQEGKNRYNKFDITQDNGSKTQLENISDIRLAISISQFALYYQPKINMSSGEVIGFEALIRWQHPVRGLITPADFLPIIESNAISLEIGEWALATALYQINQWRSIEQQISVSVNVSPYQLQQTDFAARIARLLAAYPEVSPNCLELEILETSVLSNMSQVSATMNECNELGVRFALDDFGTGYSSLNHLRHLPAQVIKIDRSFVQGMIESSDDLAIVEGIIGLAAVFKRDVIAEGVETVAQRTTLLKLGCNLAQGYGIARPMPADDIPNWLSTWKIENAWL